jgi:hypothetical protein
MRSVAALAAVAIGAVTLASGCGQQHQGTPAGPPLGGSSSSAPSPSPAPQPGDPGAAGCHGNPAPRASLVTITYADNDQTLCVRPGTAIQVFLKGMPPHKWTAIRASGMALARRANGRMTLALGVTGASFEAVRRGTAVITSLMQVCGPTATPGNAAAQSGVLECGAILGFHTTVKVT